MTERFRALFQGLPTAYGQYSNNRAKTVRQAPTDDQWGNHLTGKIGLGIVPIGEDLKTCKFGVIDIDVDDIDHIQLSEKIANLELPLVTCRSKSGGAHLYTFMERGIPARLLRRMLSKYASMLGFGQSEIFPKQDTLKEGEVGNWINLPYFDANNTIRYAFDESGNKLDLPGFLEEAEYLQKHNPLMNMKEDEIEPEGMPPCLTHYYNNGWVEGSRNEILYSFGVYCKLSNPDGFEEDLLKINYQMSNPLPVSEVNTLIGSLKKKDYRYKCKDPVLKSYCDVVGCRQLKYGVRGNELENYDEFMVGCLTKHTTDPPRWVLDINGIDVEFSSDDLMNYNRVRVLTLEKANIISPPMKAEEWLQILRDRMENLRIEEAPDDANNYGDLCQALMEFSQRSDRGQGNRDDVLRGIPTRSDIEGIGPVILFRSQDLLAFLKRKKLPVNLTGNKLWMALRFIGCGHQKIKISGKPINLWYIRTDELGTLRLDPIEKAIEI